MFFMVHSRVQCMDPETGITTQRLFLKYSSVATGIVTGAAHS